MKILKEPVSARSLKQFQFESAAWKRELGFMKEENVHLKNRLAEILKGRIDKNLLKEAESFQNSFVSDDDIINLLRHDVIEFEKLLLHQSSERRVIFKDIKEKYETIFNHLRIAKSKFENLKTEFNNYVFAKF